MGKYDENDIQRTEADIFREILAVASDNADLQAVSPEQYRAKVISDMTALVSGAKEDDAIRLFFWETGRNPDEMLDAFLERAIATL